MVLIPITGEKEASIIFPKSTPTTSCRCRISRRTTPSRCRRRPPASTPYAHTACPHREYSLFRFFREYQRRRRRLTALAGGGVRLFLQGIIPTAAATSLDGACSA